MAMMWANVAVADEDEEQLRVVITAEEEGVASVIQERLEAMGDLEVRSEEWFEQQVTSRAFNVDTIMDDPSNLGWVMGGSNIGLIIDVRVDSEEDYDVRLVTAEESRVAHSFLADRAPGGGMRRGGAAIVQLEMEEYLDRRPGALAAAVAEAEAEAAAREDDEDADSDSPSETMDPQALREQAAADADELLEALSRDWLWVGAYGRVNNKNLSVAAPEAVFVYNSGVFGGYELDVQAYPFGQSDPDLVSAGTYLNFRHGFYSLGLVQEGEDGEEATSISVTDLALEGGAMYRLDSPVDGSNRQLRFKLGGRYERFSVDENPVIPTTSMVSVVLGTRVALPMGVDELAVTAGVDIMPLGFFGAGSELFGASSFSFGFGSELGVTYEVLDNGFLSAGYEFGMMRTDFSEAGEPVGEEGDELVFVDSDAFDLKHGLRVGVVYQY